MESAFNSILSASGEPIPPRTRFRSRQKCVEIRQTETLQIVNTRFQRRTVYGHSHCQEMDHRQQFYH